MFDIYRKHYRELYFGHWWWRAREEIIAGAIRHAGIRPGGRILDVGCGGGLLFPRLGQFGTPEGIESDSELAREGDENYHIQVGDFDDSFAPGYRYELILMLDVLEHLEHPEQALRHALDLLTDTGRILVTVPALNWLWTTHDDLNMHLRRYTKRSLAQLADLAGVKLLEVRYIFHWLAAAKLLVRAKEAVIRTQPSPPKIPPAVLNGVLYRATLWEDSLLRPLALPIGNSLIALGGRAA